MVTMNNPLPREEVGPGADSGTSRTNAETPAPVPSVKITLSTSAAFPGRVEAAFRIAEAEEYDGVEVFPHRADPTSQRLNHLKDLSERYKMPIRSVHVPCIGPVTHGVWGRTPWEQLDNSVEAARKLGAKVVVLHPAFGWQRGYGGGFLEGVAARQQEADADGIRIAVENMPRRIFPYLPSWAPIGDEFTPFWTTLDVSHAAASPLSVLELADRMPRLAHVHLSDSFFGKDKHMVPGRGSQPLTSLFRYLVHIGYDGDLCMEVSTAKRARNLAGRRKLLAEARDFVWEQWPQ